MVEELFPFYLLELPTMLLVGTAVLQGSLAGVDELERIPIAQLRENRVLAHLAEPILGIGKIALAAVHDAVPETPLGRGNALGNRMRLVKKIVHQPDACQAAARHVLVDKIGRAHV